jgi:hypothetical protein
VADVREFLRPAWQTGRRSGLKISERKTAIAAEQSLRSALGRTSALMRSADGLAMSVMTTLGVAGVFRHGLCA